MEGLECKSHLVISLIALNTVNTIISPYILTLEKSVTKLMHTSLIYKNLEFCLLKQKNGHLIEKERNSFNI